MYSAAPGGGLVRAPDGGVGQGDFVDGPRACFGGGAGLLSTPMDYARFLQMLLNGGELDGVRILSPKTVELMTANHVGALYNDGYMGFGLGFEVIEHVGRTGRFGSVGTYGWGSAYFQRFFVDPQEKLVAVFYAQLIPAGGLDIQEKWRDLVYAAIIGTAGRSGDGARRVRGGRRTEARSQKHRSQKPGFRSSSDCDMTREALPRVSRREAGVFRLDVVTTRSV